MRSIKLSPGGQRRSLAAAGLWALAAATFALAGCGAASGAHAGLASHPSAGSTSASTSAKVKVKVKAVNDKNGAPAGFTVLSMTFVSDQQGFALGSVKCGSRRCLALLGTTDGGTKWHPLTPPVKRAAGPYDTCPAGQPCVSQLRFATPEIGYAFGPSLFLTTDGGAHWRHLTGPNVTSLEAADGNVVRVASSGMGCSGMPYKVQQAAAGTTAWHTLSAPPILMICPPDLYRQGERLVLVGYGNPAGGVRATAEIDRSANDGSTWASGPDQCGRKDGYAAAVALAPPNGLLLLCRHQQPNKAGNVGTAWIRVSTNGGASFGPDRDVTAPAGVPASQTIGYQLAAASASRLLVNVQGEHGNRVLLSTNGGRSWKTTLQPNGSGSVILVGFEDPATARVAHGDLAWTTTDGGQRWITDHFPA
jgi:photosystem II stability/assembly factor-like uncharacterized protein